jgi:hypothetical protein
MALDVLQYGVNSNCMYNEETQKSQIYLHASLFNINPFKLIDHYNTNTCTIKTAPTFIITSKPQSINDNYIDGSVIQLYQSKYWSHHLHLKEAHIIQGGSSINLLNKNSISIEINNWGPLIDTEHGFVTRTGIGISDNDVYEFSTPYRGFKYYHKYTESQIESLKLLLQLLGSKWNIDTQFKGPNIFNVDRRALMNQNGVYCHNSVRPDIHDISPQTTLVEMLKTI